MKSPTPRIALTAAVMALTGLIIFFAVHSGPHSIGGFFHTYLLNPITALFTGDGQKTAPDAVTDQDLEAAYLYKDSHGVDHMVFEPPEGFDYQLIYIPKMTPEQKREHYGLEIADNVRRFLKGGGTKDSGNTPPEPDGNPYRTPGVSPRENNDLPRTKAGDILSASNNLRQNSEKTKNKKKQPSP